MSDTKKPLVYMLVDKKDLFRTDEEKLERFALDKYVPYADWDIVNPSKHQVEVFPDEETALSQYLVANLPAPITDYCFYLAYGEDLSEKIFCDRLKSLGFSEMPILACQLHLPVAAYFAEGTLLLDSQKEGTTQCRGYLITKEQFNALSKFYGKHGDSVIKMTGLGPGVEGYALTSKEVLPPSDPDFEYINRMLTGLAELGIDLIDGLTYISLITGLADKIIEKHQA